MTSTPFFWYLESCTSYFRKEIHDVDAGDEDGEPFFVSSSFILFNKYVKHSSHWMLSTLFSYLMLLSAMHIGYLDWTTLFYYERQETELVFLHKVTSQPYVHGPCEYPLVSIVFIGLIPSLVIGAQVGVTIMDLSSMRLQRGSSGSSFADSRYSWDFPLTNYYPSLSPMLLIMPSSTHFMKKNGNIMIAGRLLRLTTTGHDRLKKVTIRSLLSLFDLLQIHH